MRQTETVSFVQEREIGGKGESTGTSWLVRVKVVVAKEEREREKGE